MTLSSDNGLFQAQKKPTFQGTYALSGLGNLGSGTTPITTFSSNKIKGTFEFTGGKTNPDGSIDQIVISSGT